MRRRAVEVVLLAREGTCPVERAGAGGRAGRAVRLRRCETVAQPAAAFGSIAMTPNLPEIAAGHRQAKRFLDRATIQAPAQRGADVVVLALEGLEPLAL